MLNWNRDWRHSTVLERRRGGWSGEMMRSLGGLNRHCCGNGEQSRMMVSTLLRLW
ncbi:hypothetical protein AMECASPLE_009448, partial [Ameca splendens]